MKTGTFVISIDTELAWGTFDHGGHRLWTQEYGQYRKIIFRLLELFKTYQISATWAVVGHLFLDQCQKQNGIAHPDVVRPNYKSYAKDWFSEDPATSLSKDPLWYGKDIIEFLKNATPRQDIGSHSFSHITFDDPGCSVEAAESDVRKCVELARNQGIVLKSFVFPRNKISYLSILARYGFTSYRHHAAHERSSRVKRLWGLICDMLPLTPPVVSTWKERESGLVAIPASFLFRYAHGLSSWIPAKMRVIKAKKGLEKAARENKMFHLWFHPIHFAWKGESLFRELEEILKFASQLRDEGRMEIQNMSQVAQSYVSVDNVNDKSIHFHNAKVNLFQKEYKENLNDHLYYTSAFRYGRKKIICELEKWLTQIHPGGRILDVGCGTGYFSQILRSKGFQVIAMDLASEMLTQSKKNDPTLSIQRADARAIPFLSNAFDAVISIETLRYFKDPNPFLSEIKRVLKPDGVAFITAAPKYSSNLYGVYNLICQKLKLGFMISCPQVFETKRSLENLMHQHLFWGVLVKGNFLGPFFILDKIYPRLTSFFLRHWEPLDRKLSQNQYVINFTNHFVATMKKGREGNIA